VNTFLEFHHVGCIVDDIDESVMLHQQVHQGSVHPKIFIASQQVTICFVELAKGAYLEFVQASGEDSVIHGLKKKKISYYHLGYKVADFDIAIADLERLDYKLINTFNSEAFEGRRCAFMLTPDLRLIELIEK